MPSNIFVYINIGAELINRTWPENLKLNGLLQNCSDANDFSEFDRVALESINFSNAVTNQFREEMKAANYKVQEEFKTTIKSQ